MLLLTNWLQPQPLLGNIGKAFTCHTYSHNGARGGGVGGVEPVKTTANKYVFFSVLVFVGLSLFYYSMPKENYDRNL
jgi:hypothetical protein